MKPFTFLAFSLACTLCFSSISANADNNGNGKGYGYGRDKDKHEESNKVPIDGGIGLLLVAGAALGAKKVFQKNKKQTFETE